MPYPRVCPCCGAPYPDDRSHISLSSQQHDGRTVLRLLCLPCRNEYDWDFAGARPYASQAPLGPLRQVPGTQLGKDTPAPPA